MPRRDTRTEYRWPARAGAWLAIGTSPGGLVLGASLSAEYGGPVPIVVLVAGTVLMATLLTAQGILGLVQPTGENATLGELSPRYLGRRSHGVLNFLLAVAMIGWFGFNVGLGGAALSALLALPGPVGPLLLSVPVLAFSFGGIRRWNVLAFITTISALILVGVAVVQFAPPAAPVSAAHPPDSLPGLALASIAAFLGYISVVAVRAPDFSVGLATRGDLAWCVMLLVGPAVCVILAGVAIHLATEATDLVSALAGVDGLAIGNLLVAVSIIAPALTTTYSGSMALKAVAPIGDRLAVVAIAAPGLLLAITRFDRHLLSWLVVLAAMLPALIVPMAVEALRRRRGGTARLIPVWTFLPASAVALFLTIAAQPSAPLVGLVMAGVLTASWLTFQSAPADRGVLIGTARRLSRWIGRRRRR